jgi:recombination protein RecA
MCPDPYQEVAVGQMFDPEFTTLWVAAGHFDSEQAEALGIDLSLVDVARTQAMEVAYEIMAEAAGSHEYSLVILGPWPKA